MSETFEKISAVLDGEVPPAGGEVEFDRLAHEQVLAVCRGAAAQCIEQHGYMQGAKTDSKNWFPHKWVIDAMRSLIGINVSTCSDLRAHVTRLQAEVAALQQRLNVADQQNDELEDAAVVATMRIRELDLTFGRYLLGMKAAVIADESGGNGMEWIFNGLVGPGELPPEDEHDAQAYFDREVDAIDAGLAEVFAFHDARRKASRVKP